MASGTFLQTQHFEHVPMYLNIPKRLVKSKFKAIEMQAHQLYLNELHLKLNEQ